MAPFETEAKQKDLEFSCQAEENLPDTILSDPTRLSQILQNLLSNAIKFTEKGSIKVFARLVESHDDDSATVSISVRDSGPGIPADKLESIFDPFMQVDSSATRRHSGTGLGLCISRRLAEMLGGFLAVESYPGQGSAFTLTIKIEVEKAPAPAQGEKKAPPPSEMIKSLQILLVEDDHLSQIVVQKMLKRPFDVVLDGVEAVEALQKRSYDVILMDVHLPKMNGIEATQRIRRQFSKENQPYIIALTADAMSGKREACLEAGMNDYLAKPVKYKDLTEALLRAVSS